jgi:hypothetical protein
MAQSSSYIIIKGRGTTLHFTGVTEIAHQIRLKIFDKADITEAASFVNGAKNEPDRVTLSVIETDAAHAAAGWSARMLEILYTVKRDRMLCEVVTPQKAYSDMLLSEISAVHNAEIPDGWSGELTFTEYIPLAVPGEAKADDNASTPRNTGSAAPPEKLEAAVVSAVTVGTAASAGIISGYAALAAGSTLERKLASAGVLEGGKVLYVI